MENGQERILQRIYDGVSSNMVLDVSDFKESDNRKLLQLVWRTFPRNRDATERQRAIKSMSTQTEEVSNLGITRISGKPFAPDASSSSVADLGTLFDIDQPASDSASDTSDGCCSLTDSVIRDEQSFVSPTKGRRVKSRTLGKEFETQVLNRFDCLAVEEYSESVEDSDVCVRVFQTGSGSPRTRRPSKSRSKSPAKKKREKVFSDAPVFSTDCAQLPTNSTQEETN